MGIPHLEYEMNKDQNYGRLGPVQKPPILKPCRDFVKKITFDFYGRALSLVVVVAVVLFFFELVCSP